MSRHPRIESFERRCYTAPGVVANEAEDQKEAKFSNLPAMNCFVPIAQLQRNPLFKNGLSVHYLLKHSTINMQ
jgi:hypothetical protein